MVGRFRNTSARSAERKQNMRPTNTARVFSPSRILASISDPHTDWIRYGVPAVLLTLIFFFAIRFQANRVDSVPTLRPLRTSKIISPERPIFAGPSAGDESRTLPQTTAESRVPKPAIAALPRAGQPQMPVAAGLTEQQIIGRKAVCDAAQFALSKVRKRHWRARALEFAMQAYQGRGGAQAANQAINTALQEYGRGIWDESQCLPSTGNKLAKGVIAQVLR